MNRKTCNLRKPPFFLYFICFVRHFRHFSVWFRNMYYDIHHYIILLFHFYKLVTSKPEEGWSGQPKYCFKYITLCQPCSSLWLLIVFVLYKIPLFSIKFVFFHTAHAHSLGDRVPSPTGVKGLIYKQPLTLWFTRMYCACAVTKVTE